MPSTPKLALLRTFQGIQASQEPVSGWVHLVFHAYYGFSYLLFSTSTTYSCLLLMQDYCYGVCIALILSGAFLHTEVFWSQGFHTVIIWPKNILYESKKRNLRPNTQQGAGGLGDYFQVVQRHSRLTSGYRSVRLRFGAISRSSKVFFDPVPTLKMGMRPI